MQTAHYDLDIAFCTYREKYIKGYTIINKGQANHDKKIFLRILLEEDKLPSYQGSFPCGNHCSMAVYTTMICIV